MKNELESLLRRNRDWADRVEREDPGFFARLSKQQAPRYLWIGCSDSRVPANQVIDMAPGEVFVHRNIANVMVHTDLNAMSAIQFAVDVLKVRHILVVGHYGCGGVGAALHGTRVGLADNWIRHVGDVAQKHGGLLEQVPDGARHDVLCELNVIEQAENVALTTVIRDAWARGQELAIHGWVYSLEDGLVRDLSMDVYSPDALAPVYAQALRDLRERHGVAS